jgi:hypothetical protein
MDRQTRISVYQKAERELLVTDAEIVLPGRGLQYIGRIAQLSTEGCVIETKCQLEPGTTVEVWMRTERMPLRVMANIVERRAGGMEFRFQPMPNRKMDQIEILRGELADAARAAELAGVKGAQSDTKMV